LTNRFAKDIFEKNINNFDILVSYMEITYPIVDLLRNRAPVTIKGGYPGCKPRYEGLSENLVTNEQ